MKKSFSVALLVLTCWLGMFFCAEIQDDRSSGADWNIWYDRLFGHDRSYELDDNGAMSILMRLSKGSYQLIDEEKNNTVKFWYDANTYNLNHCTEAFVNGLYTRYVRHEPGTAYGIGVIYALTNRHVLAYCYHRFSGMDIDSLNDDEKTQLFDLGAHFNQYQQQDHRESDVDWKLGNLIGSIVGLSARKNKNDFVGAWRESICNRVLTEMDKPSMHDYALVEKFLATIDYKKRQKVSTQTNDWVSAIEACKFFNSDDNLEKIWSFVTLK